MIIHLSLEIMGERLRRFIIPFSSCEVERSITRLRALTEHHPPSILASILACTVSEHR